MNGATLGQMAAFRCLMHFLPDGWEGKGTGTVGVRSEESVERDEAFLYGNLLRPDQVGERSRTILIGAEEIAGRAIQLAIRDRAYPAAKGLVPLVAVQGRMGGKVQVQVQGQVQGGERGAEFVERKELVANYLPRLMDWEEVVFPVGEVQDGNDLEALRRAWEAGLKLVPVGDPVGELDTLLDLLVHCAGNLAVPGVAQDLALCDVARSAMALAMCLAEGEEFLLVSGGISGIQDYLYDLGSEKAARILSGRSWYVEMLVLAVQERIRLDFGLLRAQTLYASGGKFLLLVPGGEARKQQLQALIHEMEDLIYATHGTDLALHIQFAATSETEMNLYGLDRAHASLKTQEAAAKQRKFHRQMRSHFADFFAPDAAEASNERDGIDNQPLKDPVNSPKLEGRDGEEDIKVNPLTRLHFDLTKKLNGAEFLALFPTDGQELYFYFQGQLVIHPCLLGIGFVMGKEWSELESLNHKRILSLGQTSLYRINGDGKNRATLFPDKPLPQSPKSYGLYLYGAKRPPVGSDANVRSYNDLAGSEPDAEDRGQDLARMGFLRMDVDNLGSALKDWGEGIITSPARIATVSRRLDQFFKGRVEALRHKLFTDSVVVHYAGGDDLFAVGRWDALIEFAICIREEFGKWTGWNPNLGLSGGLSILPVKFPVGRAAVLAGEGEDSAKAHAVLYSSSSSSGTGSGSSSGAELRKDSLTLLGVPLRWEEELEKVGKLKDEVICQMASVDGLRRSLIPKIHSHYLAWKQSEGTNLRWRWNLVWDIARMMEMHKKNGDAQTFLHRLKADVYEDAWLKEPDGRMLCTPLHALEYYRLATRWAEMALRGKQPDEIILMCENQSTPKQSEAI